MADAGGRGQRTDGPVGAPVVARETERAMSAIQPHDVPRSTRDDERLEEIRRLFDRYRRLARTADRRLEHAAGTAVVRAQTPKPADRRR